MRLDAFKQGLQSITDSAKEALEIFKPAKEALQGEVIDTQLTKLEKKVDHKENLKENPEYITALTEYLHKVLTPSEIDAIGDIFAGDTLADQLSAFVSEQTYNLEQLARGHFEPRDALQKAFDLKDGTTNIQTVLEGFYNQYTQTLGTASILTPVQAQSLTDHYKKLSVDKVNVQKKQSEYATVAQEVIQKRDHDYKQQKEKFLQNNPVMTGYPIYDEIIDRQGLSLEAFQTAYTATQHAKEQGILQKDRYLTIVDYTKSKNKERLYVVDLQTKRVILKSKAGHGKGSGIGEYINQFSNRSGSKQTSAGLFKTASSIERASHGRRSGLRLHGLEPGINDKAASRGIFIHKAGINGSEGCITIPQSSDAETINRILAGGYPIYNYTNRFDVLAQSQLIDSSSLQAA